MSPSPTWTKVCCPWTTFAFKPWVGCAICSTPKSFPRVRSSPAGMRFCVGRAISSSHIQVKTCRGIQLSLTNSSPIRTASGTAAAIGRAAPPRRRHPFLSARRGARRLGTPRHYQSADQTPRPGRRAGRVRRTDLPVGVRFRPDRGPGFPGLAIRLPAARIHRGQSGRGAGNGCSEWTLIGINQDSTSRQQSAKSGHPVETCERLLDAHCRRWRSRSR